MPLKGEKTSFVHSCWKLLQEDPALTVYRDWVLKMGSLMEIYQVVRGLQCAVGEPVLCDSCSVHAAQSYLCVLSVLVSASAAESKKPVLAL